jgi:hypothetical protein
MIRQLALITLGCGFLLGPAGAQDNVTLKSTVVALAAQPELRAEFEEGLVAKAIDLNYDAVPSYELVPDVTDLGVSVVKQMGLIWFQAKRVFCSSISYYAARR